MNKTAHINTDDRKCVGYCSKGANNNPNAICGKGSDCLNFQNIAGKIKPKDKLSSEVPNYSRKEEVTLEGMHQSTVDANEQYNKLVKDVLEHLY